MQYWTNMYGDQRQPTQVNDESSTGTRLGRKSDSTYLPSVIGRFVRETLHLDRIGHHDSLWAWRLPTNTNAFRRWGIDSWSLWLRAIMTIMRSFLQRISALWSLARHGDWKSNNKAMKWGFLTVTPSKSYRIPQIRQKSEYQMKRQSASELLLTECRWNYQHFPLLLVEIGGRDKEAPQQLSSLNKKSR